MNKKILIIIVSILLAGLVFQTLVILDYHSDRINLGFYGRGDKAQEYYKSLEEGIMAKYIAPKDIKIRFEGKTWVFEKGEAHYDNLWNDVVASMNDVFAGEQQPLEISWTSLCRRPGAAVYLGGYFPDEYIEYMLGDGVDLKGPETLDKLMFIPVPDGIEVYIHSHGTVYGGGISEGIGLLDHDNFGNFTELLTKDPNYSASYYSDMHTFRGEAEMLGFIEPDIIVNHDTAPVEIPWLVASLPSDIIDFIEAQGEEIRLNASNVLKKKLLTRSEELYETHFDTSGNLFFSNQFNVYEVTTDGLLTYQHTPGAATDDKGTLEEAFINAYEYLYSISSIAQGYMDALYLTGITESDESYTFTFDYKSGGKTVVAEGEDHAAVITATSIRTVQSRVLPMEFMEMDEGTQLDSTYVTAYGITIGLNKIDSMTLEAYDMYVGYGTFSGSRNLLWPVWVVQKENGEKIVYQLKKGGE